MTFKEAATTIYQQGGGGAKGVLRFYKGYAPALMQGPLARYCSLGNSVRWSTSKFSDSVAWH